jgi:hypothetical protein
MVPPVVGQHFPPPGATPARAAPAAFAANSAAAGVPGSHITQITTGGATSDRRYLNDRGKYFFRGKNAFYAHAFLP